MRRYTGHRTLLVAMLLGFLACGTVSARDEIAVIVARDTPDFHLDPVILRDIYLKKILLEDNGTAFIPVNLPPKNPLRRSLEEAIFNKSTQQLQDYWNQRYFHGITPPYVLRSQEAVAQFVAKTPGAIGYIASCLLDSRVKRVLSLAASSSQREALEKLCASKRTTPQ